MKNLTPTNSVTKYQQITEEKIEYQNSERENHVLLVRIHAPTHSYSEGEIYIICIIYI